MWYNVLLSCGSNHHPVLQLGEKGCFLSNLPWKPYLFIFGHFLMVLSWTKIFNVLTVACRSHDIALGCISLSIILSAFYYIYRDAHSWGKLATVLKSKIHSFSTTLVQEFVPLVDNVNINPALSDMGPVLSSYSSKPECSHRNHQLSCSSLDNTACIATYGIYYVF